MNTVFNDGYYNFEEPSIETELPMMEQPTEYHPMNICEFLSNLDLSDVLKVFSDKYGSVDYHFRYSMTAMMKSAIMGRIKNMRSFQKVVNRLKSNESDAKLLGFNGKVPDRRTFRHFENVRINSVDLEDAMDSFSISINEELIKHGEKIKRVGIDSTPLKSMAEDEDAKFNTHYGIRGYKIHGVYDLDRKIPLAIIVTDARVHDGPVLLELLYKLWDNGIKFEEVYANGAYDSYEHFAHIHAIFNAKYYGRLPKNVKKHRHGTAYEIKRQYQFHRREKDWITDADLNDMMIYLIEHDRVKPVVAYFRNQYIKEWELMEELKKNKVAPSQYNKRNVVEGFHGWIKQFLNLEIYLDYRGIKNVEREIR